MLPAKHSYGNVTDGRTDRQTDRRTDKVIPMCRYVSLCFAGDTKTMVHIPCERSCQKEYTSAI